MGSERQSIRQSDFQVFCNPNDCEPCNENSRVWILSPWILVFSKSKITQDYWDSRNLYSYWPYRPTCLESRVFLPMKRKPCLYHILLRPAEDSQLRYCVLWFNLSLCPAIRCKPFDFGSSRRVRPIQEHSTYHRTVQTTTLWFPLNWRQCLAARQNTQIFCCAGADSNARRRSPCVPGLSNRGRLAAPAAGENRWVFCQPLLPQPRPMQPMPAARVKLRTQWKAVETHARSGEWSACSIFGGEGSLPPFKQ